MAMLCFYNEKIQSQLFSKRFYDFLKFLSVFISAAKDSFRVFLSIKCTDYVSIHLFRTTAFVKKSKNE